MRTLFLATIVVLGSWSQAAFAIPAGNYDFTCRDIRDQNGTLTAVCRAIDGSWVRTRLTYSRCSGRVFIQNINGHLRCT